MFNALTKAWIQCFSWLNSRLRWNDKTEYICVTLVDARFALLFPNVAGNVCNFIWSDPGDRFHVAKFPMMCPHSILHCKLKGWVAMMGRLIYTMDKWWPIVTAFQVNAVTGSTVFLVQGFSCYGIGHQPGTWRGELYILCMGRKTGCPEKC